MTTPIGASLSLVALAALCGAAAPGMARPMWNDNAEAHAVCEVNNKMHNGMMSVKLSGDADRDFVATMIPHQQAAIDIAKIELRYGKDEETRKLAATLVAAHEQEIAAMSAWLAQHPATDMARRPMPAARYLGPAAAGSGPANPALLAQTPGAKPGTQEGTE
jgi:hypothetical protein